MAIMSFSGPEELLEWYEENAGRLGYKNRSKLICEALEEKREELEGEYPELVVEPEEGASA